jgi:hypothetical protein
MFIDNYNASNDISYMYLLPKKVALSVESLSQKDTSHYCFCEAAIFFLSQWLALK